MKPALLNKIIEKIVPRVLRDFTEPVNDLCVEDKVACQIQREAYKKVSTVTIKFIFAISH